MKTLNRTLSLVLVLVMVLGLFGVASAAKLGDFEDKGDVTYTEAVDYLTAAGIVAGDTSTTISPKGEVTREQAAKLMAYAMLGQAAAENLKAPSAPFTDVAANRWSAGYIAYCVQTGVINGMGDGTFAPEENVTGYQMAKMLLCALGYGVNGEFTGGGWALETAKYALAKDIFYGNIAGASDAPANREEAFLYTFNALTRAMLVKYNDSLGVYYSGTNPFETIDGTSTFETIGYQRFKMVKTRGDSTYREPTHFWTVDGKRVTGTYPNDPIVILASSSNGSHYDKLTNKGNAEYIGYTKDDNVYYYVNGDEVNLAAVTAAAAIRGNVINFMDTDKDGKYDTVEALVYQVAKLSAAPTVRTAGGNSVVTMADIGMKDVVDDRIDGDFASLEKDDYVIYYRNAAGTSWTVTKCETITGQLFGFNDTAFMLNINGSNYNASTIHANYKANDTLAKKAVADAFKEITDTAGLAGTVFYLDAGKNIVAAEPTQDIIAADNVVFVLNSIDPLGVVSAKVLKSDGTVAIKTITKVINTSNEAEAASIGDEGNVKDNTFYTFTEVDGALVLKAIKDEFVTSEKTYEDGDEGEKVFVKGSANFFFKKDAATADENVLGTSKTVFVLEDDTASYKAYTGVSSIPSVNVADKNTKAYVLMDKDGYAVMAVALGGALDTTLTNHDYVFVGAPGSVVQMTGNASEKYYTYQYAVVNGEIKTFDSIFEVGLPFVNDDGEQNPGIYAVDGYDNGKVSSVLTKTEHIAVSRISHPILNEGISGTDATSFKLNGKTVRPSGGTAKSFVVTDDVKVFVFDLYEKDAGKVDLSEIAIGSIENLRGDKYTLMGLRVSDKDNTINELYIVINPKEADGGGESPEPPAETETYIVDATYDSSIFNRLKATNKDNKEVFIELGDITTFKFNNVEIPKTNALAWIHAQTSGTFVVDVEGTELTVRKAFTDNITDDVVVALGNVTKETAFAALGLPETVEVEGTYGKYVVEVTWTESDYTASTETEQTINSTITLPSYLTNNDSKTVTATVTADKD